MHKGAHQAREVRHRSSLRRGANVEIVCPPFVSLAATLQGLDADSGVGVYAQNVHWELEVRSRAKSAPMLLELGVTGAIVGHSNGGSTSTRPTRPSGFGQSGARGRPPRHRVRR